MFQVRNSNSDTASFRRDIVQLFPQLAAVAANELAIKGWPPELEPVAKLNKWGTAELVAGVKALNAYASVCNFYNDPASAFMHAGLHELSAPVRTAVLMVLGLCTMSAYQYFLNESNAYKFQPRQQNYATEEVEQAADALAQDTDKARRERAKHLVNTVVENK